MTDLNYLIEVARKYMIAQGTFIYGRNAYENTIRDYNRDGFNSGYTNVDICDKYHLMKEDFKWAEEKANEYRKYKEEIKKRKNESEELEEVYRLILLQEKKIKR